MANRIIIAIALLAICFLGATWTGTVPEGFLYELIVPMGQRLGSTCYAQNDPKKPSDSVTVDDVVKPHEDTDKPKTLTPEKNVPQKTKPMKPFVPSETIPADQGVDLPYDI